MAATTLVIDIKIEMVVLKQRIPIKSQSPLWKFNSINEVSYAFVFMYFLRKLMLT